MKETSEITQEFKIVTHATSILLIPLILGIFISSQNSLAKTASAVLFLSIYISMLYGVAGGFDWSLEEISRSRLFLFLVFSGFGFGIFLYGVWYVIRKFETSMFNLSFQTTKGKLFSGKWTESGLSRK